MALLTPSLHPQRFSCAVVDYGVLALKVHPEHIILERAAAERSRRKQRQTSSQSSSLQSEPSVSSNAFMVQPGICLKRSEPVNTVCVMVVFPSLGNDLQMRSLLESLDSEHASSATSVKVKVPAMLIDAISFEESAATLTLTWSKNTRKVQVQRPLSMLDRAQEQLIQLLQAYRTYCESRKVLPPPRVASVRIQCCGVLRGVITWSLSKMDQSQIGNVRPLCLRILHSEQSSNRSLQVGRVSLIGGQSGRVNLLSSWFMNWVVTRKTLEDIDLKAAPNFQREIRQE